MTDISKRPFAIKEFSPSMTKQSFGEETDINSIVARFQKGQDISASVRERVAKYGDFSNVPSYQTALDFIVRSTGMFMSLDATVRERFFNDPGRMIAFLQDAKNYDEAVKLGLVVPREPVVEPASTAARSVSPKASSDAKSTKRSDGD